MWCGHPSISRMDRDPCSVILGGVKFRWSPSEDTVWVTYTRKFDSLEFTSVPWKMSKDHARKLWAEMVTLGWEWQGRNDHG
jgi:hypothetical protein